MNENKDLFNNSEDLSQDVSEMDSSVQNQEETVAAPAVDTVSDVADTDLDSDVKIDIVVDDDDEDDSDEGITYDEDDENKITDDSNPLKDEETLTLLSEEIKIGGDRPRKINLIKVSEKRLVDLLKNEVLNGKNTIGHNFSIATMEIDDTWIDAVENSLQSMEMIMKDPKSFIKEEREVVNIEKIRKIDHQTIRHLSSHSENVRKVYNDGRVEPSKLLGKFLETDMAIYENRVIYTLLQRLKPFIDIRYKAIKDIVEHETNNISMHSVFKFADIDFDVDMKMQATTSSADQAHMQRNMRLMDKIDNIKKRLSAIETTPFCAALRGSKLVTPPIQKTNIFKSNNDYRNCYNLWLFISGFTEVGYSINVSDKNLPIDTSYYQDLGRLIATSAATVLKTNAVRADAYKSLMYERKVEKQFKLVRNVDINHSAPHNLLDDETNLNQYYFDKVRGLVKGIKADAPKDAKGGNVYTKEINADFKKLFKGLNNINNQVFLDALKVKEPETKKAVKNLADDTPIGKQISQKQAEILDNRKMLDKLLLLQKLKEDDLNATKRRVKNHLRKMDRTELELERKIALKIAADKKIEENRLKKLKEAEKKRILKEKQRLLLKKKKEAADKKKAADKLKAENKKREEKLAAEIKKAAQKTKASADKENKEI